MAQATQQNPADFETAIAECGFGLFNIFIMMCAIPCLTAMIFTASSMSYIMPSTECDLKLTLLEKGMMHAVTYAGMIISAIPWGFIADTMGRRIVLVAGSYMDGICVVCAAFSQNAYQLMVFKFFDGFIICGPFAVVVTNLAEFHGKRHRHTAMMLAGLSISVGALLCPLLAFGLLPVHIKFYVGQLKVHTWQIFLLLSAVPALLSGLMHMFVPESPKFLMAHGNYKGALISFQRIYAMNKRKSPDSYPIKSLVDATPEHVPEQREPNSRLKMSERFCLTKRKFIDGLKQLKPMFAKPYLALSLKVYFLQVCQIMCVNSIRLWLPQIFATMHVFNKKGVHVYSMCTVLEYNARASSGNKQIEKDCDVHHDRSSYIDNIIVSCVAIGGYLFIIPIVRIPGVTNHILKVCLFISTILMGSLYFATSTMTTLILASIYLAIMGVCITTLVGMVVVVFPTLMRTMVLLLIMTVGRLGSVVGNILLPIYIQLNCIAPFIWLTALMFLSFLMSMFLKIDVQQNLN